MEPPTLVRWCPPDNDNTNAALFDFELGGKDDSFDLETQADEARKRVVALLQERNRLLVLFRELNTHGRLPVDSESLSELSNGRGGVSPWNEARMKSEPGSCSSASCNVSSGGGSKTFMPGTTRDLCSGRCTRLSQESGVEEDESLGPEAFSSEEVDLISNLQQGNNHLSSVLGRLQQLGNNSGGSYDDTFQGPADYDVRRQLGELVTRNKNFEKLLKIENPTLTNQLDEYMKNYLSELEILSIEKSQWNMENVNSMCNNKSNSVGKVDCGIQTDGSQIFNYQKLPGTNGKAAEKTMQNLINGSILPHGQQEIAVEFAEEKRKSTALEKECNDLKDKLKAVTAEKAKLQEQHEQLKENCTHQDNVQQMQIEKLDQELKQYQNMIMDYQAGEQVRKREVDQVLLQARDVLERERQEKFASMSEQNVLRKQIENLSKTMKTMQVKNEELVRFQCNQEDQVDDFKRLKKLIQENGLPTVEQVIVLQRQNESYREDLMNERKEKERLLSIKEKLRRDLDSTQSRISSLQEQVYKYREHIYFLQQRGNKDTPGSPLVPPPSPAFDLSAMPPPPSPTALPANANRLYGNNSQQYINENLLQANANANARKYPLMPYPEGKKQGPPPGRHGVDGGVSGGGGKQWTGFGQVLENTWFSDADPRISTVTKDILRNQPNPYQGQGGKYGRQMSLDGVDWKQRLNQGQPPQQTTWSTDNSFNPPSNRHNSTGSYSSMRSSSSLSGSSEDGLDTSLEKPGQYGLAGRRQNGRNGEDIRSMQNYGPPVSTFEAWPRQNVGSGNNRMPNPRNPRRYSSPVGNGIRSPNTDFWSPQQQMSAVPKSWQAQVEQNQFQESMPPGLRQTSDPWQQPSTLANSSQAQSVSVTSAQGEAATYIMSGGFGNR